MGAPTKPRGPGLAWFAVFAMALPLLGAYGAGVALERYWLTPACEVRCAARAGATLVGVTPGHKSGSPPGGCMCSDRTTAPWSGPRTVGFVQMAVFLGLAMGLAVVFFPRDPDDRPRSRRPRRPPPAGPAPGHA